MNDLQIFNRDIIPVYITSEGKKVVIGRELHERLKIGKDYSTWFKDMCAYGFTEEKDYSPISGNRSDGLPGKPRTEHILTLDMAKELCMIQRTPEGRAIRQKLIELDDDISNLSPTLREMIHIETEQKRQAKAIKDTNTRLDNIGEVISLSPNSWRKDSQHLISKIAQKLGGVEHIHDVNAEIYKLVDERAGTSLPIRLTNKRRRMADEGVCKSRRDKLNKMDVIADDKKLIEIYVAVVKEMCIKYGVDVGTEKAGVAGK
jgi:phage anti-repressor protein